MLKTLSIIVVHLTFYFFVIDSAESCENVDMTEASLGIYAEEYVESCVNGVGVHVKMPNHINGHRLEYTVLYIDSADFRVEAPLRYYEDIGASFFCTSRKALVDVSVSVAYGSDVCGGSKYVFTFDDFESISKVKKLFPK